jgi:hypothetical protein
MSETPQTDMLTRFIDLWNISDPQARHDKAHLVLAPTITYIDPHAPEAVSGVDRVLDIITRFRHFAPDAQVRSGKVIQAHHHVGRITHEIWQGDKLFAKGLFVIQHDGTGKITWIAGFLD